MSKGWIIGLASQSSGEGVEAALLETEGAGLNLQTRLLHTLHQPLAPDLRELLDRIGPSGPVEMRHVSLLHRLLGETFAGAARPRGGRASFRLQNVSFTGCPPPTL